jgi:hypothetical protein
MATQARQTVRREIEIFSAGCATCRAEIDRVRRIAAAENVRVHVHDMQDDKVAERAKGLGIYKVPAVVITTQSAAGTRPTHKLAACCTARGIDEAIIRDELRAK